jgi:uncharacterized protein (DUF58 family)
MEAKDLLKKVRKIEIKSRGLTNQVFAGEYHSAYKGKGMAFSEVREYQYGDPVKDIDWHVTARFNHPYIKVFEEERELTVMLLIDVSGSKAFGTRQKFKQELATEIAAILSFSAIQNNDKIGVILFLIKLRNLSPQKGRKHILRIILELLDYKPNSTKTDVTQALKFLTNAIKKRSTAFIISDFVSPDFSDALKIAGKKHDLAALRVYDSFEQELPDLGLAYFLDAETREQKWVDTSSKSVRREYRRWWKQKYDEASVTFRKANVDYADIRTDQDYVKPLIGLFKNR